MIAGHTNALNDRCPNTPRSPQAWPAGAGRLQGDLPAGLRRLFAAAAGMSKEYTPCSPSRFPGPVHEAEETVGRHKANHAQILPFPPVSIQEDDGRDASDAILLSESLVQ